VLCYELPLEHVIARIGGRRVCEQCKAVFHVRTQPPAQEGICDRCGGALFQRLDDRPEAVRVRMEAYERSTLPLLEYYRRRGLLCTVSADGAPETVLARTRHALAEVAAD
jgi:adenylate kinase